jgi:hypothetical protein
LEEAHLIKFTILFRSFRYLSGRANCNLSEYTPYRIFQRIEAFFQKNTKAANCSARAGVHYVPHPFAAAPA